MNTHIHTHTHTNTWTHTHTYTHTKTHHTHINIHTYTHTHTNTHTHTHKHKHTCIHTNTHMHTQIYSNTHYTQHPHTCTQNYVSITCIISDTRVWNCGSALTDLIRKNTGKTFREIRTAPTAVGTSSPPHQHGSSITAISFLALRDGIWDLNLCHTYVLPLGSSITQ